MIRSLGVVEAVAPDGSVRRLGRQDPVFEGDTLRTGARGRAQIRFTDRGLMSLRPETVLSLDDYEFDAASPTTARQEMSLTRGGFRAMTGRTADNNRAGYRVNTPLAVIGVRGTIWDGFQTPDGPLVLGVSDGGIDATTRSGRTARLGMNSGFNFARINLDGTVDYLVQVPTELEASAGLDEGGDDGDDDSGTDDSGTDDSGGGGGDDEGGGGLGGTEESSTTTGGGASDSTAGTPSTDSTTTVISTATNTEGNVNQNLQGDGDLATTEPVLDAGLTSPEQTQLLDGGGVAVATSLEQLSVTSGIGVVATDGVPVVAGSPSGTGFAAGFESTARQTALDAATFRLGSRSGEFTLMSLSRDTGGITWGSYAAPVDLFGSFLDETSSSGTDGESALRSSLQINQDVLFAIGTPRDVADLTGTSFFASSFFDARTAGLALDGVTSDAFLDFGTGALSGILDVFLSEAGTGPDGSDRLFAYIVDFDGFVRGGLLQETTISMGRFEERTPGSFTGQPDGEFIDASISGFVAGGEAEFLQLAFAYSTPARADAAVSGLVFLDTPRLLSAEASALAQGFRFVGAFCCNDEGVAGGLAVDARQNGGNTILGLNFGLTQEGSEPLEPGEPGFADVPPDLILRNGGAVTSTSGFTDPGTDTLASVVWTSAIPAVSFDADGFFPGIQGFDAASGAPANVLFDELFFVTGLPTTFADLTGQFAYSDAVLLDGVFVDRSASVPTAEAIADLEVFFEVDFGTGEISSGSLSLFDGAGAPTFGVLFEGFVRGDGGFNGADLVIIEGFAGASGLLDLGRSELGGFFAGENGEAFAGAFSLFRSDLPQEARGTFYALGSPTVIIPPNALTPDEVSELLAAPTVALSTSLDQISVGSGIGVVTTDGVPVLTGPLSGNGFALGFEGTARQSLLDGADFRIGVQSGAFTLMTPGTFGDLQWGSYAAPVDLFGSFPDPNAMGEFLDFLAIGQDVLFAVGTPRDLADLTGTSHYFASFFDARTSGLNFDGVESDAVLDFGTGALSGILDVFLSETGTGPSGGDRLFEYIVDFDGVVRGGLLQETVLTLGTFQEITPGSFAGAPTGEAIDGTISGFVSGGEAEYLQLAFAYSTPARADAAVSGLVLLETSRLLAAETTLLDQGFGFVEAVCCFDGRTFVGSATDPRLSMGQDTILAYEDLPLMEILLNGPGSNQTIQRRDGANVVGYRADFGMLGGAELSTFEWQGFNAGGPVGVYDAATGARIDGIAGNVLVLAGLRADVANLTGVRRFELDQLTQGFLTGMSMVPPQPIQGAEISFNVDFNSAAITGGQAFLFTDADDVGLPAIERDRVEAFFGGTVDIANGSPEAQLFVLGGFVVDADLDTGGNGIVNSGASTMSGFFAGDGSVFNLAFNLTTAEERMEGAEPFVEPINLVGTAILREADLALTAAEQVDLEQGFAFAAAACCDPLSSTGAGIAGDPAMRGGDILLGLNLDAMGEDLSPLAPGFLDPSPETIARLLGGFPLILPDFPVPPEAGLIVGAWFSPPFEGSALIDPANGDILEFLDETLLFMVARPSSIATLQAAGFQTFAGDSREFSMVIDDFTFGGLIATNVETAVPPMQLDPDDVFVGVEFLNGPEATVSFNVDFATGQVTNGHLFTVLVGNTSDGEEAGLQLFFDGTMNLGTGGNAFVEVNLLDGTLGGIPLNFDETDLEIFFIGDGAGAGSSLVAVGSYTGVTTPTADFPDPISVAGTFSIGSELLPETRLAAADATALNGGRIGIVAYSELAGFFPGGDAPGAGGLIIGRANAPTGPNSFLFAGNRLDEPAFDPVTGSPLGTTVQTARRDFFSQPYDFVVRQDSAMETLFSSDAVPTGGSSLAGFEIAWGIWNGGPSTPDPIGAKIQDAPGDPGLGVTIDRDLFFTSVNPTPRGQMPVTGVFSYSTAMGATNGTDFLGVGGGSLLVEGTGADPLQSLDVSFSLDFATGDITSGLLATSYTDGMSTVQWTGNFNGFVNGALADLEFTGLDLLLDGSPTSFVPDLGASDISGVFTGPAGERLVGGFSLFATDGLSSFEGAAGVFIMDRLPAGPPK